MPSQQCRFELNFLIKYSRKLNAKVLFEKDLISFLNFA